MSESRIADQEPVASENDAEILDTENIKPGSKSICHATVQLMFDQHEATIRKVKAKLDSCGSVSIAHSNLLNSIKPSLKSKSTVYSSVVLLVRTKV